MSATWLLHLPSDAKGTDIAAHLCKGENGSIDINIHQALAAEPGELQTHTTHVTVNTSFMLLAAGDSSR
jgi:hypothetical protein